MPTHRLIFLDRLRVLALGALVLYHLGMAHVPWPWHLKGAALVPALEPWMRLLEPWRMSLLFCLSGIVTARLLASGGQGALRQRLRRLGAPLLAGVLVLVPPQAWWQVQAQWGYGGSLVDFMGLYLRGDRGFCAPAGPCLVLPTWNHLWFLPYLMAYTVLWWAASRWWPGRADTAPPRPGWPLAWWLLVPWALLAALRVVLHPLGGITHDLLFDAPGHAQYLPVFLVGAWWGRTAGPWDALARLRWLTLGLALAAWGLREGAVAPAALAPAAYALQQWAGVLAALGWGRQWLDRPGPHAAAWARAASLVFPVYVLHQTLLLGALVALRPWGLAPAAEAALLGLATVGGSVLLALAAERLPALAPWVGARRR